MQDSFRLRTIHTVFELVLYQHSNRRQTRGSKMKNPKLSMAVTSIIGAVGGICFTIVVDPPYNYYYFMLLFAMIGTLIGYLVLFVIDGILKEES